MLNIFNWMINLNSKSKTGISACLTLTVSAVFLLNILCGFEVGLTHQHEGSHPANNQEAHSHEHSDHSDGHNHGSEDDDDCCEDVTKQFFAQLFKEQGKTYTFLHIAKVFYTGFPPSTKVVAPVEQGRNLEHYFNLPPPFQDRSKQVLFQTFII